jgi:FkbM family methyltransferase
MVKAPSFEFDRCDTYMYFTPDTLPDRPNIVEVGSIHGAHGIKLCKKFNNNLTMIAYEAGQENYKSLCRGLSPFSISHSGGCCQPRIVAHNAAVTGRDGEVEFFEFKEISSNSIFPRHVNEGRNLKCVNLIKSVSLETVLKDNHLDRLDLLFLNCEGAELGILNEVLLKPLLRNRLGQLCVSFHGNRIYPQEKTDEMVQMMSEFFWVVEEQNDWPCHLFVNKGLELVRG